MDTDSIEVEKLDKPPPQMTPKNDIEQNSMVKLATKLNGTVVSTKPLPSKGEFKFRVVKKKMHFIAFFVLKLVYLL